MGEKRFVAVLRHGHCDSGDLTRLTPHGISQMESVAGVLHALLLRQYGHNGFGDPDCFQLTVGFSYQSRLLQSARILKVEDPLILYDYGMTERDEIESPELIAIEVRGLLDKFSAQVVVVVAHGDMPPVLAEVLATSAGGTPGRLEGVSFGCGYLVDLETGEVTTLSPKPEEVKPLQSGPVLVYRGAPAFTPVPAAARVPVVASPSTGFDDMDDDIPF